MSSAVVTPSHSRPTTPVIDPNEGRTRPTSAASRPPSAADMDRSSSRPPSASTSRPLSARPMSAGSTRAVTPLPENVEETLIIGQSAQADMFTADDYRPSSASKQDVSGSRATLQSKGW